MRAGRDGGRGAGLHRGGGPLRRSRGTSRSTEASDTPGRARLVLDPGTSDNNGQRSQTLHERAMRAVRRAAFGSPSPAHAPLGQARSVAGAIGGAGCEALPRTCRAPAFARSTQALDARSSHPIATLPLLRRRASAPRASRPSRRPGRQRARTRSHPDGGGISAGRGHSRGSPRSWGIRRPRPKDPPRDPCLSTAAVCHAHGRLVPGRAAWWTDALQVRRLGPRARGSW